MRAGPFVGAQPSPGTLVPGSFEVYDTQLPRGIGTALRFSTPQGGPFAPGTEAQLGIMRISP